MGYEQEKAHDSAIRVRKSDEKNDKSQGLKANKRITIGDFLRTHIKATGYPSSLQLNPRIIHESISNR